jgi:hypothetical protein
VGSSVGVELIAGVGESGIVVSVKESWGAAVIVEVDSIARHDWSIIIMNNVQIFRKQKITLFFHCFFTYASRKIMRTNFNIHRYSMQQTSGRK